MVRTRRRRKASSPPAAQAGGGAHPHGWAGLHPDLLSCCLSALLAQADQRQGLLVCRSWAAVLSSCRAWRALALQTPIDAVCPPSPELIAWLRRVRVRRLEFVQRASERGDALCAQGFASSEQRYRASIATLLATLDFINNSAGCLRELAGVHPREGILLLHPFTALERIAMTGNASETCKLDVLAGLPRLQEVCASGYGEYSTEGLPPSVRHLSLQWAVLSATSFQTISFVVPEGCQLASLALSSQRPLCLAAPSLARCASLRASARRLYLGLPLRRGAPWADVDELAARWAQFMLAGPLETVEITATRSFVFQPVQEAFDLATNDGLGGVAQHEQLATVLLARHFQSLHVEQRALAVGAFRAFIRISRRCAQPVAFSFSAPLHPEQLEFLQQHALATSISFGPMSRCDAITVLNCPAFAARNATLLQQLSHLELSSQLDLSPYTALHSMQGTWQSEPLAPLGAAQLSSLRVTPPLGAAAAQRCFQSRWLRGVQRLGSLTLMRFASADLSHLRGAASTISLSSLQPPGGLVGPDSLVLPPGGFGASCSLALRMAYAPPHAIPALQPVQQQQQVAGGQAMAPGALAVALQQHAAAAAALAEQAVAALQNAAGPHPAGLQGAQAVQQGQGAAQALAQQQQQQQAPGAAAADVEMIEILDSSDEDDDGDVVIVAEQPAPPPPQLAAQQGLPGLQLLQQQMQLAQQQVLAAQQQAVAGAAAGPAGAAAAGAAGAAQQPALPQQQQQQPPAAAAALPPALGPDLLVDPAAAPPVPLAPGQALPELMDSDSDDDDLQVPGLLDASDDEGAFLPPLAPQPAGAAQGGVGAGGLGPWILVQPHQAPLHFQGLPQGLLQQIQAAAAGGPHVAGPAGAAMWDIGQPWEMPDDRLSDVTLRHDALFAAAGALSVHAGALTVVYTGACPDDFLALLTHGPGGGRGAIAGDAGPLRSLRLSARSLRFVAAPAQAGEGAAAAASSATGSAAQQQQQQAAAEAHSCSGVELRDYIATSEWAAVWDTKLQRSMFRDQETLVLTRRATPAGTPGLPVPATV